MSGSSPDNGYNIPLDIVEVVEQHGTVGEAHALAGAVVEEPHDAVAGLLRQNLAAVEEEFRGGAIDCLAGADTVSVVLIAVGVAAVGDFPQLPALPGVGGAVVGEHVADAVVGDGLAVVLGQQVAPAAVVDVGAGLQGGRRQGSSRKGVELYRLDVPSVSADMLRPSVILFIFLQLQYLDQTFPQLFILGDIKSAYLLGNIDTLSAKGNTCHKSAVFEPLLHIAVDQAPKRRRNAVHAENGDHVHIGVDGRLAALARENVGDGVVGRLRPFLRQLRHAKDAHAVPLAALQRVGIHGHSAFGLRHRRFHRGIPILPQGPAQNPGKFFIRSIRARKNLRLHRLRLHPAE